MPIDFTLSGSQKKQQAEARSFAAQVLANAKKTYTGHNTQTERFRSIRPLYCIATQGGMIRGQIPTALGGTNDSLVDAAIAIEEMYATDPSVTLTVAATGLGLTPLIMSGHADLQKKHLKPFLEADEGATPLASLVHSEPGGTANWLEVGGGGLQTTARKEGDSWILNGEKLWTTNSAGWDGRGADLACVVARMTDIEHAETTNGTNGTNGLSNGADHTSMTNPGEHIIVLCVDRSIIAANKPESYRIIDEPELMGHPATSGPHTLFSEFHVPATQVLAQGLSAAQLIETSFTASAALVAAFSTSIMRAAFDAALKFTKEDARGGKVKIIERQSVADRLMSMKMKTDAARLMCWKALHALENGPGDFKARQELCLEAKIWASDACAEVVMDAMKVVGMTSYRRDLPFAQLLNDAMCLPLFDGGNIGIRRRQFEKILQLDDYNSTWAW